MSTPLDVYLRTGETITLGREHFTAEKIKAFAARYDPQLFHLDEEAARQSVFGGLCASGWHTAAAWMKHSVRTPIGGTWTGQGPEPFRGPSPGFTNLKWSKPVFADETVIYTRTVTGCRPLSSRPGWQIASTRAEGFDSKGDKVIEFDGGVFLKAD